VCSVSQHHTPTFRTTQQHIRHHFQPTLNPAPRPPPQKTSKMKTKAHFFPELNLATILEPADPNDKLSACTKVCCGWGGPA